MDTKTRKPMDSNIIPSWLKFGMINNSLIKERTIQKSAGRDDQLSDPTFHSVFLIQNLIPTRIVRIVNQEKLNCGRCNCALTVGGSFSGPSTEHTTEDAILIARTENARV